MGRPTDAPERRPAAGCRRLAKEEVSMIRTMTMRRSAPARPTLWTPAFAAVTLAAFAYFTGDGVLIPALPRYVQGPLAAGNVAVGLVVGAFSLSAFFLRPWVGSVADRWGRRPLMLVGACLFAASVLGYALAPSLEVLAGLRLLTGAGEAFFFVGAVTVIADLAPAQRRGEAISLVSLALYGGIGLGPLLGEAAIERYGFASAWVLAATAALTALVLALRVPETRADDAGPEAAGAPSGHPLVHRASLLPGVVLLTSILGMAGFLTFVPLYALDLGMDGSRGVLLLFAGIIVGMRSLGARIPDRLGAGRATRMALALSAVGLAVVGAWRTPAGLVTGAVVFAIGIALFTPAIMTLAMEGVAPQERGSVIGTTSAFIDLAFGLGPATLGIVAASIGRPGTFLAGASVAAAGLLLVVWTRLGRGSADHALRTS
jgi:predicted MFS family arabinose efflux permease